MEVIGVIGSLANVIEVTAKCIKVLRDLQLRWQAVGFTVTSLISQLGVLKAALDQINQWMIFSADGSSQHHQLTMDLSITLECCKNLISFVDDHISRLDWDEADNLTFQSKAMAVMDDGGVRQCVGYLNNQSIALNLLLAALNR